MRKMVLFVATVGCFLLAACGGTQTAIVNPPPPPPAPPAVIHGAQFGPGGFGVTDIQPTTAAQLEPHGLFSRLLSALDPKVYAAGTATISGSYSGSCVELPPPGLNPPDGAALPLYQLGQPYANCSMQPNSTFTVPDGPGFGYEAIGAGTLSTLIASAYALNSTPPAVFTVFVNGKPTAITCTIENNGRCEDTVDTVAVNDGDYIAIAVTYHTGDLWRAPEALVLKQ